MGLEIVAKQIERIGHHYGEQLEVQHEKEPEEKEEEIEQKDSLHYVMVDGSMVLTKKSSWKEMKLSRVFEASDCMEVSENRNWLKKSDYTAYFGSKDPFLERLSKQIAGLNQMVFLGDGAKWMWNWVGDHHPEAFQILDYYHAVEHIAEFAKYAIRGKTLRSQWVKQQEELLMEDQIDELIIQLVDWPCKTDKQEEKRHKLHTYLENNKERMRYKTYRENGYMIGSGAIESAHRTVIQKRLKLSGQRWTPEGAQQIVNLRANYMSNKWEDVKNLIRSAA